MIHKAAMGNKPSAIIYFNKKYNINLEDTDENKMNALHLAVRNNMENSVIFLLSLGLDPNLRDKDGCTALHYAVKKAQPRIVKLSDFFISQIFISLFKINSFNF